MAGNLRDFDSGTEERAARDIKLVAQRDVDIRDVLFRRSRRAHCVSDSSSCFVATRSRVTVDSMVYMFVDRLPAPCGDCCCGGADIGEQMCVYTLTGFTNGATARQTLNG